MNKILLRILFIVTSSTFFSAHAQLKSNEEIKQEKIEQQIKKLDKINYLPSILPVIINNKDVIELNDKQVDALLTWRHKNRDDVIATMNEIKNKRILIKEAALSPKVTSARIQQMQTEIFRLQRKVLNHKLSCRELVIKTFNRNNWEGFFFVLAENESSINIPDLSD